MSEAGEEFLQVFAHADRHRSRRHEDRSDRAGREHPRAVRRRVATPRDYAGTLDAIVRSWRRSRARPGAPARWASASPASSAAPPAWSRTPTPPGSSAGRCWPTSSPALRPVRIANDANCFTLSEAIDGAGRGLETVFGVILGTGVGGGIAIRQRILEGPNEIAGEWGHNPLPWMTDEERAARAGVLLREGRVRRDVSVRSRLRARPRACSVQALGQEIVRAAAGGDAAAPAGRWRGTRIGWPARSPPSSTCSTLTSSCWAAACPTCRTSRRR